MLISAVIASRVASKSQFTPVTSPRAFSVVCTLNPWPIANVSGLVTIETTMPSMNSAAKRIQKPAYVLCAAPASGVSVFQGSAGTADSTAAPQPPQKLAPVRSAAPHWLQKVGAIPIPRRRGAPAQQRGQPIIGRTGQRAATTSTGGTMPDTFTLGVNFSHRHATWLD